MYSSVTQSDPLSRDNAYPVETVRVLAILLVVVYHVIGSGPTAGLQIAAPAFARYVADFLVDIHMPLFAFISGYVYAFKPLSTENLSRFLTGKFLRLVPPGIIAITAFLAASQFSGTAFDQGDEWWQSYIFPYAHFWFLQAILVIFVVYGSFDIITGGRWLLISFALSLGWYLFGPGFPTDFMSINHAAYLLPYFIFGIIFNRHQSLIAAHAGKTALIAGAVFVIGLIANFYILEATGDFSLGKLDLQSLATGLSIPILCLVLLPNIGIMDRLSPAIFTIYLYHVFGTSLMRRCLDAVGIQQLSTHLLLGTAAGILLPLVVYQAATRHSWTRRFVLGLKK